MATTQTRRPIDIFKWIKKNLTSIDILKIGDIREPIVYHLSENITQSLNNPVKLRMANVTHENIVDVVLVYGTCLSDDNRRTLIDDIDNHIYSNSKSLFEWINNGLSPVTLDHKKTSELKSHLEQLAEQLNISDAVVIEFLPYKLNLRNKATKQLMTNVIKTYGKHLYVGDILKILAKINNIIKEKEPTIEEGIAVNTKMNALFNSSGKRYEYEWHGPGGWHIPGDSNYVEGFDKEMIDILNTINNESPFDLSSRKAVLDRINNDDRSKSMYMAIGNYLNESI